MQICRVEDILVEGLIEGSVVHFHRARTIDVQPYGIISTSGMGLILISFSFIFDVTILSLFYVTPLFLVSIGFP